MVITAQIHLNVQAKSESTYTVRPVQGAGNQNTFGICPINQTEFIVHQFFVFAKHPNRNSCSNAPEHFRFKHIFASKIWD